MGGSSTISAALAACLLATTSTVQADDLAEGLIGLGLGLAIGKALSDAGKNEGRREQNVERRSRSSGGARQQRQPTAQELRRQAELEAEREANRDMQKRLNALGFNAGGVDGEIGPQTLSAIRSFQASLGSPMTGVLTPDEMRTLHARSEGGAPIPVLAPLPEVEAPGQLAAPLPPSDLPLNEHLGMVTPPGEGDASIEQEGVSANFDASVIDGESARPDMAVLGVHLLDERGQAELLLQQAGYDSCEPSGSAMVCESTVDGMNDRLVVGFARNGSAEVVHTLSRVVTFDEPAARQSLVAQLDETYPELMARPAMSLASTDDCSTHAAAMRTSGFRELVDWSLSGQEAGAGISAFAAKCEYHYSIELTGGDRIDSLSITFFNGTPISQALTAGDAGGQSEPRVRF